MLRISFKEVAESPADVLVLGIKEGAELGQSARKINDVLSGALQRAIDAYQFKGALGKILTISAPTGVDYKHIILIGLGDVAEVHEKDAQSIGGSIFKAVSATRAKTAHVALEDGLNPVVVSANAAYGAVLRSYRFDKYKTQLKDEDKPTLESISFGLAQAEAAEVLYQTLEAVAKGVL
jgi:leucyl aminopeptidase